MVTTRDNDGEVSVAGSRGRCRRSGVRDSGPTSESPGALSVPRPPPLAVPPSVPGARASFSGARARAMSAGAQQEGLHFVHLVFFFFAQTQARMHAHTVPFPAAAVQLPAQLPGDGLQVHEVAEAPPGALPVEGTTTC